MQPTRRWWITATLGLALLGAGWLLRSPLVGLAGGAVGAWLVGRQALFLLRLRRLLAGLSVRQTVAPATVLAGRPAHLSATVDCAGPTARPLSAVTLRPPLAATVDGDRTIPVAPGDTTVTATLALELDVAGRYATDRLELAFEDEAGLYRTTTTVGEGAAVTVEPSVPRDAYVGTGDQRIAVGYGEHEAVQGSGGTEPSELRQYLPGDPRNRIDWKATARRGEPYVREFEAATDRETLLFVDHRGTTATGDDGRTQLDYLREVALWIADRAERVDDPIGLHTIGDDGITGGIDAATGAEHHRRLRTTLSDLEPTGDRTGASPRSRGGTRPRPSAGAIAATDGLGSTGGPDGAFAETLRPFLGTGGTVERVEEEPLARTVRATVKRFSGEPWVVICSTDADRQELLDAAKAAGRGSGVVSLFLTPGALFEAEGLTDLEAAYESYRSFDSFRRDLSTDAGVDAYEVGPERRLEAIVERRRRNRG